ncbi:MAG: hypothetical protein FJ207_14115 [Gemmatimonadetes bacterium]|nr:hypothetical protein [Gemmatimonadota bacterium]
MALRGSDITLLVACVGIAAATAVLWRPHVDVELAEALPGPASSRGFTTSDTCQSCHPDQYDSWRESYHRKMTQAATPESVLGTFDVVLEDGGFRWRLERRGDEFWIRMPDPLWFDQPVWLMRALDESWPEVPPEIEVRVVMTTGSHHIQNYWIRRPENASLGPDDGALIEVPWAWLVETARWVPNRLSFLTPPRDVDAPGASARWNANCSQCHSVGTEPRFSEAEATFDTRSAELGIACEACHGPAERHVEHYRSPIRRYLRYLRLARGDDPPDPTIVNPAKLEPLRANEVCAQCHSFGEWADQAAYLREGIAFLPGGELSPMRRVFAYEDAGTDTLLRAIVEDDPLALEGRYWPDGTIRIAGREYNGLLGSTHAGPDGLTCLSCHSMHAYETADTQLDPGHAGNQGCVGCHREYDVDTGHTRHETGSSGSDCMNCHMPHTTYGPFSAMRSHRIDSPDVEASVRSGRPNACNLCHLDRTLEWSAQYLSEWYGRPPVQLGEDERRIAASALWALRGDAAQRAVVAWHMGWRPAREASGDTWQVPYLAQLLTDPYAATRHVAHGSLTTFAGFGEFAYDFTGSDGALAASADRALARWRAAPGSRVDAALLMTAPGEVDLDQWRRLLAVRNHRPLTIRE